MTLAANHTAAVVVEHPETVLAAAFWTGMMLSVQYVRRDTGKVEKYLNPSSTRGMLDRVRVESDLGRRTAR